MLDAAHGEGVRAINGSKRVHVTRIGTQEARIAAPCSIGSSGPITAVRANTIQDSRRAGAVARSRRMKQSLE